MLSEHAICPAERAAAFGARAGEDQTVLANLAERERYARALSRWDLAVRGEPLRVDDFVAWIGALVDALATVDQAAAPSLIDSFALPARRHAG